ncbi:MAG: DUF4203 domain-containing protein [Lachnospiraceae bacterium]|nr:DUF4203 domain-containing protein [Lachnospiraceae bacterium]
MDDILYFLGLLIPNLDKALKTIGVVTLLFGLANAFFGYKLFKAMISLIGFLVCAFAGGMVFIQTQSIFSDSEKFWIYVLAGGLIGSFLADIFHDLGVFLVTGAMGAAAGFLITQSTETALVVGVIVGFLSVFFEKYVIIISTAISGGRLAALGILFMRLAEGEYKEAWGVGWLIAVCGMVVQFLSVCLPDQQIPEKDVAGEEGLGERGLVAGGAGIAQNAVNSTYKRIDSACRCPKCGTLAAPEIKFCGKCGFAIKENIVNEAPANGNYIAGNNTAENSAERNDIETDSTTGNNTERSNIAGDNTAENSTERNGMAGNTAIGNGITGSKVNGNSMGAKSVGKNVYCGKCGTKLPEHARFCPKCGAAQD